MQNTNYNYYYYLATSIMPSLLCLFYKASINGTTNETNPAGHYPGQSTDTERQTKMDVPADKTKC